MKKWFYLGLLVVAIAGASFYANSSGYLTLESLRHYHVQLEALVQSRPLTAGFGFFLIYVMVTALSIPGAVIMTLAGGALFGLLWGTILVSFASTIGATLAFVIARFLGRSLVKKRFGERLERVRRGIDSDGPLYLFSLRLVPVFPFFLINILMALTAIRTLTFFLVSQVGMLPATLVYVNAGTQLATIRAVDDILSPRLLLSFALLAAFPWLARLSLKIIRRR
jgi:uncharacterized membrane protein YdjX (TVP38/TMEM64 family)